MNSRVLINYGSALNITDDLIALFRVDPGAAVHKLTARMTEALAAVCSMRCIV